MGMGNAGVNTMVEEVCLVIMKYVKVDTDALASALGHKPSIDEIKNYAINSRKTVNGIVIDSEILPKFVPANLQ
jgi:septum formation topological specificity factor MinE